MKHDINRQIFASAQSAWEAAGKLRERRERFKRYTYGRQWSDIVTDINGRQMLESDSIIEAGRHPLTNNMIRQIVKTVIGRYRLLAAEQGIYDPTERGYVADNSLLELDCRMLEEFLISGCAIQRVAREPRGGRTSLRIDNVDPRAFFVNAFRDPIGRDIELVGMLHDMTMPEILSRFGHGDHGRNVALAKIFSRVAALPAVVRQSEIGEANQSPHDFFTPSPGHYRLIEVWTLDNDLSLICHDRHEGGAFRMPATSGNRHALNDVNSRRRQDGRQEVKVRESVGYVWCCRWYAADGTLISSCRSPYSHASHPFAVKFYPLTDGEVHSFVEDVIDQQRCINRMIVLIDSIIGSSAKGVLLFPQEQKPKNIEWREIAETWSQSNGIIPITGMHPELPKQIVGNGSDCGAYGLLSLQMKLFDNISGVSDVLAGRNISPSTGNAVYQNQLNNSVAAISDLIESFASFRKHRDYLADNV